MPEPVTLEADEVIVNRHDLAALILEVGLTREELAELARSHAQLVSTLDGFATRCEPLLVRVEKRGAMAGALFRKGA